MINNGLIKTKISVTNTIVNLKANTLKMIMNFRRPNTSSFHSHIQQRCTLCWKKIQHTVCCTQEVWVYSDSKRMQVTGIKLWFRSWIITFSIVVTSSFLIKTSMESNCLIVHLVASWNWNLCTLCCIVMIGCVNYWTLVSHSEHFNN